LPDPGAPSNTIRMIGRLPVGTMLPLGPMCLTRLADWPTWVSPLPSAAPKTAKLPSRQPWPAAPSKGTSPDPGEGWTFCPNRQLAWLDVTYVKVTTDRRAILDVLVYNSFDVGVHVPRLISAATDGERITIVMPRLLHRRGCASPPTSLDCIDLDRFSASPAGRGRGPPP